MTHEYLATKITFAMLSIPLKPRKTYFFKLKITNSIVNKTIKTMLNYNMTPTAYVTLGPIYVTLGPIPNCEI